MTDSNTTFTEMIPKVSLAAVRVSISAFNAAVVAERESTLRCSKVVMMQDTGGSRAREWGVG
jgi:hypothetical protein